MAMTHRRGQSRRPLFFAYGLALGLAVLGQRQAQAITSNWILQDASGNWNNPDNWDNGVPKEPGDVAFITNAVALSAARTITIDTPVSLKALKFAIPGTGGFGYTVQLGSGGSLTMDSGGDGNATLIQLQGSARCKITAATTLSNDVEVINSAGAATYFDVSNPISGNHNILINPDGATSQPYMTVANPAFLGNMTLCAGKLLVAADCFGNTSEGTRVITFVSNAYLRVNAGSGGVFTPAANRQVVSGVGGGSLDGNTRIMVLNAPDQFAGTGLFTLHSQNANFGGLQLNAANNGFTGTLAVNTLQTFRLGAGGSVSNAPLIQLLTATSVFDASAKAGGYEMPAGQVLAGLGVVSGLVNVASAAVLHPGSYTLPGPSTAPGILKLADGLSFSGGSYAWDLAQLKDGAFAPGTTTYGQVNVLDGGVSLDGGTLTIRFLNGIDTPDTANAFWQTEHVWPILTAAAPPTGVLAVEDGTYDGWGFKTRVSGNTLELVYYKRNGLMISVH